VAEEVAEAEILAAGGLQEQMAMPSMYPYAKTSPLVLTQFNFAGQLVSNYVSTPSWVEIISNQIVRESEQSKDMSVSVPARENKTSKPHGTHFCDPTDFSLCIGALGAETLRNLSDHRNKSPWSMEALSSRSASARSSACAACVSHTLGTGGGAGAREAAARDRGSASAIRDSAGTS
jgi:hypothetical protein